MKARSQVYAETVFNHVDSIRGIERNKQKRYGALCHRFPLIVRENGLAAAFGFLAAKAGNDRNSPEQLLLEHYTSTLGETDTDALRSKAINSSLIEYRHLTFQTIAAAEWFKRYAEAVLKVDSTGIGEEEGEGENA